MLLDLSMIYPCASMDMASPGILRSDRYKFISDLTQLYRMYFSNSNQNKSAMMQTDKISTMPASQPSIYSE